MATYKVTFNYYGKEKVCIVTEVCNKEEAILVANIDNPDIPMDASIKVELMYE